MYISIGKVSKILGVSISTLRRWDTFRKLFSSFTTIGKHRRYLLNDILYFADQIVPQHEQQNNSSRTRAIIYCRVSRSKRKQDLHTQQQFLEQYVKKHNWIWSKRFTC